MKECIASYSLFEIVEIVASMLEVVKPDDCFSFMSLLYQRLSENTHILKFINLKDEEQKIKCFDEINTSEKLSNSHIQSDKLIEAQTVKSSLAEDKLENSSHDPQEVIQSRNEPEVNAIDDSKQQDNGYIEETKEGASKEDCPRSVKNDFQSAAMQSLENTPEKSFINVIIYCFGHFDELGQMISPEIENYPLLSTFQTLVKKVKTN